MVCCKYRATILVIDNNCRQPAEIPHCGYNIIMCTPLEFLTVFFSLHLHCSGYMHLLRVKVQWLYVLYGHLLFYRICRGAMVYCLLFYTHTLQPDYTTTILPIMCVYLYYTQYRWYSTIRKYIIKYGSDVVWHGVFTCCLSSRIDDGKSWPISIKSCRPANRRGKKLQSYTYEHINRYK